jgi:excinuclease ABC subunit A
MSKEKIIIKGAREHNLKGIDLELPRNQLIVMTGLSGSGKSSLAFDTIYAEGQRRYVESLSAYARQFLGQMEKPEVEYIEGLSPAISIDQKGTSKNPRSTVGTITEIYDYLRLLFARIGQPHCPSCGKAIHAQTIEQMTDRLMENPEGTRLHILAPLVRGRKGEFKELLQQVQKQGFVRVRVDGILYELGEEILLEKNKRHTIEVVVDRLVLHPEAKSRLYESLETAVNLSKGTVLVDLNGKEIMLSDKLTCTECGISLDEIAPRSFSFNSPYGACPKCTGVGAIIDFDPKLIISDKNLSVYDGCIAPLGKVVRDYAHHAAETAYWKKLEEACNMRGIRLSKAWKALKSEEQAFILYGEKIAVQEENPRWSRSSNGKFQGVIPFLKKRYEETSSWHVRWEIEKYMDYLPCPECKGDKLKKEALSVKIQGKNIADVTRLNIKEALHFFENLKLTPRQEQIAHQILKEIKSRLNFLIDVGLEYLTLMRRATTLSGGESQRIRLATQIGSQLVGVLYILDEPSIGLHQRDNRKLLATLKALRDLGNTLIVVEHDEETIREADYIVDIGPGAGEHGGRVVAAGPLEAILACSESITGKYLSKEWTIPIPSKRREGNGKFLILKGARENNLKNITVKFPLGKIIGITGVSGSGKSTLIYDILYKALARHFSGSMEKPGDYDSIIGLEEIDKVILIDQSPIGRTPRSNPATYTGAFDPIREIFSMTPEARARGYKPGRFSFNVPGGRCEACRGDGIITIEMHFLPDVYVPCEQCKGKRYNRETLEVKYKGKTIADVLEMTVEEALKHFENIPAIEKKLETLRDVGLSYIKLGQPATTLSGGEAQRVKLADQLSRKATGRTLYLLDEPTTGLHFHDVAKLLEVFDRLVEGGNTLIVIEHNLEVIKRVDWIIDLGPEGGDAGGRIVAEGTPEEVAENPQSYTGCYLKEILFQEGAKI